VETARGVSGSGDRECDPGTKLMPQELNFPTPSEFIFECCLVGAVG